MALSTIDWATIGKLVWVAPVAGLAVSITFSLLVLGLSRAGECRRDGRSGATAAFTAVAVAAGLAFAAVVIYGVEIITTK